jgi:hypothetical protein
MVKGMLEPIKSERGKLIPRPLVGQAVPGGEFGPRLRQVPGAETE